MSIIVAAHNSSNIFICSDGLSTTTAMGSRRPDFTIEKIAKINNHLALMITGNYQSDKLDFISEFKQSEKDTVELEIAFEHLFVIAKQSMPIHPDEGFMIGLAGYTDGRPTFMFLTRAFNDDIGYITDYPYSYYVSGRKEATELAEARLKPRSTVVALNCRWGGSSGSE